MRHSKVIALLLIAAALPSVAGAAELQVTSSTQFLGYNDLLSGDKDQGSIAQYLRMNYVGFGEKGQFSIFGYGRLLGALQTKNEPRPELVDNVTGRLYYLYLDARDLLPDHLDLRVGRTYVPDTSITGTVDGAYLNARNLGVRGLGVTAFGGHHVTFDNLTETGNPGDLLAGASVYFDTVRRTHLEAGYARQWFDGEFARDYFGVNLSSQPLDELGLIARVKYDIPAQRLAEILAGVNVVPWEPLTLKAEFVISRPTFDQFSFYRFFNVNRYMELGAGAEFQVISSLRVNARYAYEDFEDDQHAHVIEAGASFRPIKELVVNASWLNRNGFGGRLSGLRFNAGYTIGPVGLVAGLDYDDFRREFSRTGTAKKWWVGANYEINKTFSAAVHAENNLNFYYSHAFQGTAALIIHL